MEIISSETTSKKRESGYQINVLDIIFMTLRQWPWILLSLLVCVGGALWYVLKSEPIYSRTAEVVIKDVDGSESGEMSAFADMGLMKFTSSINDEMNKFTSPDVMEEVVKRLSLDKNYYVDGRFHREVVYGSTLPIQVSFPTLMEDEGASVTIHLNGDGTYSVEDLILNGKEVDVPADKRIALGKQLRTGAGVVFVSATPYNTPGDEKNVYVTRIPVKVAAAIYGSRLAVGLKSQKGTTVNITAIDESTRRAEDVINAVIDVYGENWVRFRNQVAVSTSNFINERLVMIEKELGNVDSDISDYRSRNLIPDEKSVAGMYLSDNHAQEAELLDLNNRLIMTRYMRDYVTAPANRGKVLPANSGVENSAIESMISEYNAKLLERNTLAANSSDTHPKVTDADSQLAEMRNAIVSTIDNSILVLNNQIRSLQGSKSNAETRIAESPMQSKYLLSVERQQKVKESLYLYLLQKREENELTQAFTAYNTEVITRPIGSNAPIAPSSKIILLSAFAIGLLFPFVVVFIKELSNTTVRGRKDVESLSIPFLGEIPEIAHKKSWHERLTGQKDDMDRTPQVVVKQGSRDAVNEAFRVMRTNIGFMSGNDGNIVSMVTSFNPGSGKTFIAMNLGISLAIRGKRVLVIDGDLRRASASAYVEKPKQGLSNYLVGEVKNVDDVIVADSIVAGLSVLPVGAIPPNPTELLESDRFTSLVSEMRGRFDVVLIDCPPVEMMADAQIIENVVDRTIFVIRAGLLQRSMLPELDNLYEAKKYKNMTLVLNSTENLNGRYGNRYGSKYGYGYGYSYGYGRSSYGYYSSSSDSKN